ncbi:immunity 8 family protein [Microvirga sp. W0021]|uniref:Immunity 8 family protein n=1 Tax=Hohaiivirga grylli TaxID=3133970 RepID=A0ABV0BLG9_9HYPH
MKAEIKKIMSPDVDLKTYKPEKDDFFGFLIEIFIGPHDFDGSEMFQVVVCTPEWLKENMINGKVLIGYRFILIEFYDMNKIFSEIKSYVENCSGNNWQEIALKLCRFAHWEFEDYKI